MRKKADENIRIENIDPVVWNVLYVSICLFRLFLLLYLHY
jgi:hypothetical protein